MTRLSPSAQVLDIGGWAHPFNRANWVMDLGAYETRGYYNRTFARNNPIPPSGGEVECFSKATWIQRDICGREPYPFEDKALDYVVCSHTLEDIRDPLWVCSEIMRIGKAGYIEIPSRLWETCRGHTPGITGVCHHRWLIEITGDHIVFMQKFHTIHRWRYSLPKKVLRSLSPEQSATWLFWEGSFSWEEGLHHGEEQDRQLTNFVNKHRRYPKWRIRVEDLLHQSLMRFGNLRSRLRRMCQQKPGPPN